MLLLTVMFQLEHMPFGVKGVSVNTEKYVEMACPRVPHAKKGIDRVN